MMQKNQKFNGIEWFVVKLEQQLTITQPDKNI